MSMSAGDHVRRGGEFGRRHGPSRDQTQSDASARRADISDGKVIDEIRR